MPKDLLGQYWDMNTEASEAYERDQMFEKLAAKCNRGSAQLPYGPCTECGLVDLANVVFNRRWLCFRHFNAAKAAGEQWEFYGPPQPQNAKGARA